MQLKNFKLNTILFFALPLPSRTRTIIEISSAITSSLLRATSYQLTPLYPIQILTDVCKISELIMSHINLAHLT